MRLRPPHVLVVFNAEELTGAWTTAREHMLTTSTFTTFCSLSRDADGRFAVRHAVHTVVLPRPHQSDLTISMQNCCVAIGLSAPAFGSVRSVDVGGRARCVLAPCNCQDQPVEDQLLNLGDIGWKNLAVWRVGMLLRGRDHSPHHPWGAGRAPRRAAFA